MKGKGIRMKRMMKIMLVCLLTLTMLIGCSSEDETKKIEETVTKGLDTVKKFDEEEGKQYFLREDFFELDEDDFDEEFYKLVFENLENSIKDVSFTKDTANVTTEIINLDMSNMADKLLLDMVDFMIDYMFDDDLILSEEELDDIFDELLFEALRSENEKTNVTVDIELIKTDNEWKIITDDELINSLSGGLVESFEKIYDDSLLEEMFLEKLEEMYGDDFFDYDLLD